MAPLIALIFVTALARLAGALQLAKGRFTTLPDALSAGVAAMFLITGEAHFIGLREELIKMVPPAFGNPGFWVTFTGVAEIAGAVGILIPSLRRAATIGLLLLLVAVFPANVRAASEKLTIGGRPATPLVQRGLEQVFFLIAVGWAGFGRRGTTEQVVN